MARKWLKKFVETWADILHLIYPNVCLICKNELVKCSFERKDCKDSLNTFDIIINCINLKENVGSWFDNSTVFSGKTVIIDISCDYNNVFNPIKLYNYHTKEVSVICIN